MPKVECFAYKTPLSTFVHAVLRGERNFSASLGGKGKKPKAAKTASGAVSGAGAAESRRQGHFRRRESGFPAARVRSE